MRLNADSNTIDYVLDTYSKYIDNLRIVDLRRLMQEDPYIKENSNVYDSLRTIMQLIIDECGVDIVNDIDLQDRALVTYYSDVVFKQHVNVKKDSIQPYEFNYAKFLDGITIQSRILPRGTLTGASMSGIVDLTSVEILGSDNLNFQSVAGCTVKLSKNLKEIDASTFSVSMANKPIIEFDGTIKEFNELIENNISRWTKKIDKSLFILTVKALGIECNDGTWTSKLLGSDK